LELERVIASRARLGHLGLDDALNLFDELLLNARPASVAAFNQPLTALSCLGPALLHLRVRARRLPLQPDDT
jgi:hypothetical protein